MLMSLMLIPWMTGVFIVMIDESKKDMIKRVALTGTMIEAMLSMWMYVNFDQSECGYQFEMGWSKTGLINLSLGVDGLGLMYVMLTTMLTPICVIASWENVKKDVKNYFILIQIIETLVVSVFIVTDLFMFYVFFEAVLVPFFMMIGIWGGSSRSAFLLFLYTLAGSLFMLVAILKIRQHTGSTNYMLINSMYMGSIENYIWVGFWIALMTKAPMVPVHIWLPRAHADAPLAGSMLLAGVVLKLATYGMIRMLITMMPDATKYFTPLVETIAVISLIYASFATVRQIDLKALIAYSSVAHMAIVIIGLFSNTLIGIQGGLMLSFAHGVVSPTLFMLVGGVLYDRFHTRLIRYYRGLIETMPVFAFFFFIATCSNMAVPLSGNWLAEIMSLAGIFQLSPIVSAFSALGIILSAAYSIWLYIRIMGGSMSVFLSYATDITRREFHILMPLTIAAIWLGIAPNPMLNLIESTVTYLIF